MIDDPCDIVIVFALAEEAGGLVDRLTDVKSVKASGFVVRRGSLGTAQVAVVEAGIGQARVARVLPAVLRAHKPSWLISAGFAGGLVETLERGDLFVAESVVCGEQPEQTLEPRSLLGDLLSRSSIHRGRLATVDAIVRLPDEKRVLGEQLDAAAVDMETYAVAATCAKHGTPVLSIRVISDAVTDEISADIAHIGQQASKAGRVGAAIGSLFRRPSSIKDMLRLREQSLVASDTLAEFLVAVIAKLLESHSLSIPDPSQDEHQTRADIDAEAPRREDAKEEGSE